MEMFPIFQPSSPSGGFYVEIGAPLEDCGEFTDLGRVLDSRGWKGLIYKTNPLEATRAL